MTKAVPWIFGDTELVDNTEVGFRDDTEVGFVEITGCTLLIVLPAPASASLATFSALYSAKLIAITSH